MAASALIRGLTTLGFREGQGSSRNSCDSDVSDARHWATFYRNPLDDDKPSDVTNKNLVKSLQGPDRL
jgi:hypothetical protein